MAPHVSQIINGSLATGQVPLSFKHSVVTPLIEKPGLDAMVMSKFRPISKLTLKQQTQHGLKLKLGGGKEEQYKKTTERLALNLNKLYWEPLE